MVLCVCLWTITFFKKSNNRFFICSYQIRRLIGDFGVPIAIFLMIVVDYNIDDTYTQVGPCSLASKSF